MNINKLLEKGFIERREALKITKERILNNIETITQERKNYINNEIEKMELLISQEKNKLIKSILKDLNDSIKIEKEILNEKIIENKEALFRDEEELHSKELENLRSENFPEFINRIIFLYWQFALYPNPIILNRFEKFGFLKKDLIWFIPINAIINELNLINESKTFVRILPTNTIRIIEFHLFFKIADTVLKWGKVEGKKRSGNSYNESHNNFVDMFRRKRNLKLKTTNNNKSDKHRLDPFLFNIIGEMSKDLGGEDKVEYFLLNSLQGKTEKIDLRIIMEDCTYYSCSETKMYCELFSFYKLILPDGSLWSQDEFLSSKESEGYEANYKLYQYNKLKRLLNSTSDKSFK